MSPRAPKCEKPNGENDDQVIAHFKTIGACFSYISGNNREKAEAPCAGPDGYCQKVLGSTSGITGVSEWITSLPPCTQQE